MSSKAKLPYKPRWIQQVLWMVLLPLVVATALLLILRQFTIQTEEALYQEIAQANTIRELNHLISQWGTLQGSAILSEAGVKGLRKDYSLEHNELNASIELQFSRVRKLSWRKRLNEERLQRLINIFLSGEPNEQFKLLRSETSSPNSGFIEKAKALMKINHLSSEAKSIVTAEWNEHEGLIKADDQAHQLQMQAVLIMCIADLVLVLALIWRFRIQSSRLYTLIRHAGSVSEAEDFAGQIEGDDEIAFLDKLLFQAQNDLKESADLRQAIIGMVAHDLRSPLMASSVDLENIEQRSIGLSDEGFLLFDTVYKRIAELLERANELLTEQRETGSDTDSEQKDINNSVEHNISQNSSSPDSVKQFRASRRSLFEPGRSAKLRAINLGRGDAMHRPESAWRQQRSIPVVVIYKVALLVFIPFALMFGVFGYVYSEFGKSEKLLKGSRWFTEFVVAKQLSYIEFIQGASARAISISTEDTKQHDVFVSAIEECRKNYSQMQELAAHDQRWANYVALSHRLEENRIKKLQDLKPGTTFSELSARLVALSEMSSSLPEAVAERNDYEHLSKAEIEKLQALQSDQLDRNEELSSFIEQAILLNMGLSMGLLLWFNFDTKRILAALILRASKLSIGEELQSAKVSGNDELAYLEFVLQKSAEQIREQAKMRRELMLKLRETMSAPLRLAREELLQFQTIEEKTLSNEASSCLRRVLNNIERTQTVISLLESVETFSNTKLELRLKPCESLALVHSAVEATASLAKIRGITIDLSGCENLELVADDNCLVQVLTNYLSNAIKFSPNNSLIEITASNTAQSELLFSVRDHGPGLDEKIRALVFDRYFQAPSELKQQGFGLGLAICKLIVEAHGGRVGVESCPGEGSKFWFAVPNRAQ